MANKLYYLNNIRELLTKSFNDEELRALCFDVPDFQPVYHQLAQNTGKTKIVAQLLEHAEKTLQIDTLLALAREYNPARYDEHAPYYVDNHKSSRSREPNPTPIKIPQNILPQQPFEPELILIPAGEFLMGTDPQRDKFFIETRKTHQSNKIVLALLNSELPPHRLYLPDYYMAKTPVTNAQYNIFVLATGYETQAEEADNSLVWKDSGWTEVEGANWQHPIGPESDISQRDDHPVVQVSWYDAVAYVEWLAQITGKPYHLPSEAEWEKAARGTDGRIYPWGNEWDAQWCNAYESGKNDTTPVDAYPAATSPYGVWDIAGNVWEWTASLWGANKNRPASKYPYRADDGREALNSGEIFLRVLRGGSFDDGHYSARCAYRDRDYPFKGTFSRGFRVALSLI